MAGTDKHFIPIKTTAAKLSGIAIKEGQVIFLSDTGEAYVDYSSALRLSIGSVVYIDNEADRLVMSGMVEYKLYYVESSSKMYSYINKAWKCLNPDVITTFTGLTDTPSVYTGCGGMAVHVKSDETGLEYVSPNSVVTKVMLSGNLVAKVGQVLCVTSSGYILADSTDKNKMNDVVLVCVGGSSSVSVLEFGYQKITGFNVGDVLYLGQSGAVTNVKPSKGYVKIIGYCVSQNIVKFKPDSYYK